MPNIYIAPDTQEKIILLDEIERDKYTVSYYCIYKGKHETITFPMFPTSWNYTIN